MSDEGAEPEEEIEDYDSGPFCGNHWHDIDCDELCKCGHRCNHHAGPDYCEEDGCPCEKYEDAE